MISTLAAISVATIPLGVSTQDLDLDGLMLKVHTYKPAAYVGERMLMVFHGTLRNATEYRDDARQMGDRFRALIVAPEFDSQRFPSFKYQFGGILRADRTLAPEAEWTYTLIPKIASRIRQMEKRPNMPFYLIGHSAGGQFLVRLAGFSNPGAKRIVAANPGSHLFPTRDLKFGYGFGDLPEEISTDDRIREYLAQPLSVYLGTADNGPDEYFDMSESAMAQGASRYERGLNCFERAKSLARERGWPFGWKLYIARTIRHDHTSMFNHPMCELALFGGYLPRTAAK
jgi:poly(3-hydroxybutyrate) depolymerase